MSSAINDLREKEQRFNHFLLVLSLTTDISPHPHDREPLQSCLLAGALYVVMLDYFQVQSAPKNAKTG